MTRRVPLAICIVFGFIAAPGGLPLAAQAPRTQCTVAGKGDVDLGWVEKTAGVSYRCVQAFDSSFKASGTTWIRVNADGTLGAKPPA